MAAAPAPGKSFRGLNLFLLCTLTSLLLSCGGTRLVPQLAAENPTALVVDSLILPDPATELYLVPYKKKLDSTLDSIMGYAAHELAKELVESGLGNFVADVTREAAQQASDVPVDMGVVTIGGLRIALAEGPIRLRDIYELMPFENRLVVLRLTGEETLALFKFAAKHKIVAISNSKMLVRDDTPVQILINGKPFDPAQSYTVATSDYLAGGGDNMAFFRNAERAKQTDLLLRTAILNKIIALHQQGKQLDNKVEGRIEILE